jgi:hypothetical protein
MRYPNYRLPIEKINDNLYQIVAEWPIDRIRDPRGVKEWLGVEIAFKHAQRGVYLFCNKIEEVKIIE